MNNRHYHAQISAGMDVDQFLDRCLLLDIEYSRSGAIFAVGAVWKDKEFVQAGNIEPRRTLSQLDEFSAEADFVLGHNVLNHDLPLLQCIAPRLGLLKKPVVDTLYLSPLAFPENPYHRLVKDYKLVRDSINNPVADARLAASIFKDQSYSFTEQHASTPGLLSFYRYCFSGSDKFLGLQDVFAEFDSESIDRSNRIEQFKKLVGNYVCRHALQDVASRFLLEAGLRIVLAYCVAWLRVAGGNSVLPPWVRRELPEISTVITKLREINCGNHDCAYCRTVHDARGQLTRYFGFSSFRSKPATEDGQSLQQTIVEAAMMDRPLLAVLPTGGGKSLCFQLPALIRYQRRGVLTVVISPLQALMKDQVDNLRKRTGAPNAEALYGMLTPPERGEVLNGIRLGDIAVLYVSPEQLRNRSFRECIGLREIGCWVFDEAHCLSKWGHDFRPDYLYAARFIKEFCKTQKQAVPPVQCFTATAKPDVKSEILDYFNRELGQALDLFEGGIERDNLHFEVQTVTRAEKYSRVNEVLQDRLPETGSAIVYCSTRAATEKLRDLLLKRGWAADAFHAGLDPAAKRHIQENFISGAVRIICATNAFGMGIDKEDVRLVVHADIPGSLENYIQEAGRAGRDREEAECILLYDEQDIESQFSLEAYSELSRKDIAQILRGLRRARRDEHGEVILTAGELLRDDDLNISFDAGERSASNKVAAAVAWLERAGFLRRNENRTQVFQGRPLIANLDEAKMRIERLGLPAHQQKFWLAILEALLNADSDRGFSADELAEMLPVADLTAKRNGESKSFLSASQRVIRTLHDMAHAGLLKQTMVLTAFVRHKVKNHSTLNFDKVCQLERTMLDALQEEAPDADAGNWQNLSLRRLNQRMLDAGESISNPEILRHLLVSLSQDGQGLAGSRGSIDIRYVGQDRYKVKLHRSWKNLRVTSDRRRETARVVLESILSRIPAGTRPSAELLVEFALEDLLASLRNDAGLSGTLKDPLAAADRALMFLHEQRVITLQKGLAVFRQAMTVRVLESQKGRKYSKGDFETLSRYYGERVFQIHVINEYARQALEKVGQALALVVAYFSQDKSQFVKRFFSDRKELLERATSQQSYQKIVEELQNPVQIAVCAADEDDNVLILAGPGSGKTRVVVHRCAYLLRVKRVNPQSILVLCFNRNAAISLRKQLRALVGSDANHVTVQTYHGLALRLTGHSFAVATEKEREFEQTLEHIIQDAAAMLTNDLEIQGMDNGEWRDRILGRYRHILVDEYQDIDEDQYNLVSALSGRLLNDADSKLSILAVGDDDQNIYQFRGSNIEFIKRFQEDYRAEVHYLLENYRSTANIVSAANALVRQNTDRMKRNKDIRVNASRQELPAGGRWSLLDPFVGGRVQILRIKDQVQQAHAMLEELRRLKYADPALQWPECAILAREWSTLCTIRAVFESQRIPVCMTLSSKFQPPLFRIRENARFTQFLMDQRDQICSASSLIHGLQRSLCGRINPWIDQLVRILEDWKEETNDLRLPANQTLEYVLENLGELRRDNKIGRGVLLSTVHSAKGMEFPHVLVADGGWNRGNGPLAQEEQRRLLYVAMTRARETLGLFQTENDSNRFLRAVEGNFVLRRNGMDRTVGAVTVAPLYYAVLGMQDLNLGFAGRFPADHPIHLALASLKTGSELEIAKVDNRIALKHAGRQVCVLSKSACEHWRTRVAGIKKARVLAMAYRQREDGDKAYQDRFKSDRWEVPLVELFYHN